MKTLYSVLESIADDDSKVLANHYAAVSLPTYIARIYHEIFGDVIKSSSKEPDVIRISKWFTIGFIDEDHIMIDDFEGTCKNMEKWVKEFKALFRQRAYIDKKTKVNIEITKDKLGETVTWKANITVSYGKYDYEISLMITGNTSNETKQGMVWTTSEKLKQLL